MTAPYTPPAPTDEDIRAQYGFVALLAQQVPEIGALMQQAVREKWTSDRFQMSVASTAWWKATPAPTRQWVTMQIADPATATRTMLTGANKVMQMAQQYGFGQVNESQGKAMWLSAKLWGYDDEQLQTYVFNYMRRFGTPASGGEYGSRVQEYMALAQQYGYDPRDLRGQVETSAANALGAGMDRQTGITAWREKLQRWAAAKYRPFADRIMAGETVQDLAQPYVDVVSDTLELNPQDVSLKNHYIQRWMQGDQSGGSTPVWKAQQELRKDPRWQYTNNANKTVSDTLTALGRQFGMIG